MNYSDICEQLLKTRNLLCITEHLTNHWEGGESSEYRTSIVSNILYVFADILA